MDTDQDYEAELPLLGWMGSALGNARMQPAPGEVDGVQVVLREYAIQPVPGLTQILL